MTAVRRDRAAIRIQARWRGHHQMGLYRTAILCASLAFPYDLSAAHLTANECQGCSLGDMADSAQSEDQRHPLIKLSAYLL